MKKTIVSVLLTVCFVLTAFPVAALELEQPETASAAEVTVGTSASSAELSAALPTEHETYGTLVYFKDFSGTAETGFNNLADVNVLYTAGATNKGGSDCVYLQNAFHNPYTIGVALAPADGGTVWKYTDGSKINGELTVAFDMYLDSATVPRLFTVAYPGTSWGDFYTPWDDSLRSLKSYEWAFLYSQPLPTSYSEIGLLTNAWEPVCIRSVALYVKTPDQNFYIADSADAEEKTAVAVADSTYFTFPTEHNGAKVSYWRSSAESHAAGERVLTLSLSGQTFYPAVLPEAYSETYGQLVYYRDYISGAGVTVCGLADVNVLYTTSATNKGGSDCVYLYGVSHQPNTIGVALAPADGTVWQYADGTPLTGELTVASDMYLDSATVPKLFTVAYPGNAWGEFNTPWDDYLRSLKSYEWAFLYSQPLPTSYSEIGLVTAAWEPVCIRSAALYVKNPTNAFWLTDSDGANREFILVPDGTYTFPDTFAGQAVEIWTDGTSCYAAGEQANIADIAAKTFRPVTAPKTLASNSIRFGENKGLRFAATVDLALRASSATEEYGFLVTRKSLLGENANDTLKVWISDGSEVWDTEEKTLGLTEEGVTFVAGRAWKNDGSVDLIYDNVGGTKLDEESIKNGEAIGITAVLTGITDKRCGEVFVVRPYVKIAGSYFYGEARENSYYNVAKVLRGSAAYDSLTEEQKAEIDNVIASVEN